ncbi:MAG TPA: TIGR04255 family protein [Candidatus Tumulicola sp.]|nr:TIGR04255 family protein [Candidatus Tumulicola sp.]
MTTEQWPRLAKAPIIEGLLDIQFKPLPPERLDDLAKLQPILTGYGTPEPKLALAAQILVGRPGESNVAQSTSIIGFQYRYNHTRAFQARLNGITLSFLAPYPDFPTLEREARSLWDSFRNAFPLLEVTRVALRYINRLILPLPFSDFNDFIRISPSIAPSIPQGLSSFQMRLVIPDDETRSTAIVGEIMEGPALNGSAISIIFDIDVFQEVKQPISEEVMWDIVAKLRGYKNRVFFGAATDKLLEMYR